MLRDGLRSLSLILLALIISACAPRDAKQGDQVPVLRDLGAYELTDQDGSPLGSAALQGKPYVVSFFFTRCPSICATIMDVMKQVGERLTGEGLPHHLVSITVDPENDKPPDLKAYLEKLAPGVQNWSLLTGDPEALEKTVTKTFVTYMGKPEKQPSGLMDIGHGGHLLLIDSQGRMRGTYGATEPETIGRIAADIRKLAGNR